MNWKPLDEEQMYAAAKEGTAEIREKLGVSAGSSLGTGIKLAFMEGALWYQKRIKEELK